MIDHLDLAFVFDGTEHPPVRETVEALRSFGCTARSGGEIARHSCAATDWNGEMVPIDDAVDAISSGGRGSVTLWYTGIDISWWFGWGRSERDDVTAVKFSIPQVQFRESHIHETTLDERLTAVIDVTEVVWNATRPDYGLVASDTWYSEPVPPGWDYYDSWERPLEEWVLDSIRGEIRHVGWLTCLPPWLVEEVGIETLRELPITEIRMNDDGSAIVRFSEHPIESDGIYNDDRRQFEQVLNVPRTPSENHCVTEEEGDTLETLTRDEEWGDEAFRGAGEATFENRDNQRET